MGFPGPSTVDRFPVDALLRKHGFQIWERKKGKEPVWRKKQDFYSQSQALLKIEPETVADIKYLEELMKEGY